MENKPTRLIDSIPEEKTLDEYFDSLDIFEKRKMIEEIRSIGESFYKDLNKQIAFCIFCWSLSIIFYFGVRETWALIYFSVINIPLTIIVLLNRRDSIAYKSVARYFEKKMAN